MIPFPSDRRRSAYTLLELIIALGLMAMLLSAAWSVLGTYRNAEQRGWQLSQRLQIIRTARQWLEEDALHWLPPAQVVVNGSAVTSPRSPRLEIDDFQGDAHGFSTIIRPSIDPLPWLDQLTRDSQIDAGRHAEVRDVESDTPVRVSYRVVDLESVDDVVMPMATELKKCLERRVVPVQRSTKSLFDRKSMLASASNERVLSAKDLYRQSSEYDALANADPNSEIATICDLRRVRFRYTDGQQWTSTWTSQTAGGPPRAIELAFDLPSRNSVFRINDRRSSEAQRGSKSSALRNRPLSPQREWTKSKPPSGATVDSLVSGDIASSVDGNEREGHDVRIVVLMADLARSRPVTSTSSTSNIESLQPAASARRKY